MANENNPLVQFCTKCGKKFEANDIFCVGCGTKRESTASISPETPANIPSQAPQAPVANKKVNKKMSAGGLIVCAFVLLLAGIYLGLKLPDFIKTDSADKNVEDKAEDKDNSAKEDSVDDYEYDIYDDEVVITAYIGSNSKAVIPSKIEGVKVTIIGIDAFSGCEDLTDIILPSTITEISDYAFANCSIKEITIPKSVTWVYDSAFADCAKLKSVYFEGDMPDYIDEYTFDNCAKNFTIYYKKGNEGWADFDIYLTKTY